LDRAIGRPGILEASTFVSFSVVQAGDRDGLGADAEVAQQSAELLLGQRLAPLPFRPRSLWVGDKLGHEVDGTNGVGLAEGKPDILQKLDANGAFLRLA
jgi:hypothetical protein